MKFSIRRKQETVDAMFSAVGFTAHGALKAIRKMIASDGREVRRGWYYRQKHSGCGHNFCTVHVGVVFE